MRLAAAALANFPSPAAEPSKPNLPWAEGLEPLHLRNTKTEAEADVLLYHPDGELDPDALAEFARVAGDEAMPAPLAPRLMQLLVKAANHFHAKSLVIISAYRPKQRGKRNGYHATGEALDFQMPGVDYRKVAAHLRSYPRAGVGVYTDPRTHFVHLDVRQQSYHWLDASPPGVHWKEAMLRDPDRERRDLSYTEESDLPVDPAPKVDAVR